MSVNMIKQNSVASHFNDKAKMLNLSIEEQAELLSKLYPDKIQFIVKDNLEGEKGIVIRLIDRTLDILELPECELIDFNNLFYDYYGSDIDYACNLPNISTLKLPKCAKNIKLEFGSDLLLVNRLFAWDDCIINIDKIKDSSHSNIEMLIMQYSDGRKPIIYRF